jgi:uncharacterized protein
MASAQTVTLGSDITGGMKLQHVVRGGVWQGSRLLKGGDYALLGTTMAPGFDYQDFAKGHTEELIAKYPQDAARIRKLVRS